MRGSKREEMGGAKKRKGEEKWCNYIFIKKQKKIYACVKDQE